MIFAGEKLGKLFALFPVMYLSTGTCVIFIITGGGTLKLFYQLICDDGSSNLTTTEWFLVFISLAILVSLFCPDLHSVALVSFIGGIMAIGYCTTLWVLFVAKGRADDTSYDPSKVVASEAGRVRSILNALGIIAVAFRGHNVVLEIQVHFFKAIHPIDWHNINPKSIPLTLIINDSFLCCKRVQCHQHQIVHQQSSCGKE